MSLHQSRAVILNFSILQVTNDACPSYLLLEVQGRAFNMQGLYEQNDNKTQYDCQGIKLLPLIQCLHLVQSLCCFSGHLQVASQTQDSEFTSLQSWCRWTFDFTACKSDSCSSSCHIALWRNIDCLSNYVACSRLHCICKKHLVVVIGTSEGLMFSLIRQQYSIKQYDPMTQTWRCSQLSQQIETCIMYTWYITCIWYWHQLTVGIKCLGNCFVD